MLYHQGNNTMEVLKKSYTNAKKREEKRGKERKKRFKHESIIRGRERIKKKKKKK